MTSQPKFPPVPSITGSSANSPCIMPRLSSESEVIYSEVHHENDGLDLRIASDTWCKLAASEARLHLMVQLGHLEVGFPDVENFCLELETKYRAKVDGELREKGTKSPEWKIVKLCMTLKMIDERQVNSKLETERYEARKKIEKVLGKNSRRARNIVKKLRQEAAKHKVILIKKYEEKLKNLQRKYRKNEEEKIDKIPEALENLGLENISVFSREKYDKKQVTKYEPEIIGDIDDLHDNERLILMLPPKFSIEENLPRDGLLIDEEMAYAKTRMTINKEREERIDEEDEGLGLGEEDDPEKEEELERLEAESRQVYDPRKRTFDDRKRRATDLKECARVTLPKPMDTKNEAHIEMRRGTNEQIYNTYIGEVCNKRGEVKGNLTEEEKDGLRRLQKRIREKEVVILKTDKSGRLCLVTREEYERMGLEHTSKDTKIDR